MYGGSAVSVHDRATGRRLRAHGAVRYEPYHDVCLAGDDGIWVVPVVNGSDVGFALFFEGGSTAVYYEQLDRAPRHLRLRADEEVLYGAALVHGRLTPRGLRIEPSLVTGAP